MKTSVTVILLSAGLACHAAFAEDGKETFERRVVDSLFKDAIATDKTPSVVDKKGCLWVIYELAPGDVRLLQIKDHDGNQQCRSSAH